MKEPKNFDNLMELWGSTSLQKDLKISRQYAYDMRQKGYIPEKYWAKLLVKAKGKGIRLNLTMLERFYDNIRS